MIAAFGLALVTCTVSVQSQVTGPEDIWLTEIGSGPPTVIVLHGGPGLTHRYLRPEWDRLADVARVVYYDQRGCGWSERTDSVSWQRHLADLDSIVSSARQAGAVVLGGSSWGSVLAALYVNRFPDRVSALILSGVPDLAGNLLPLVRRQGDVALQPPRADSTVNFGDSLHVFRDDSLVMRVTVSAVSLGAIPVQDSATIADQPGNIAPELAARMGMACPGVLSATRSSLARSIPPAADLGAVDLPVLIVRGSEENVVGDGSEDLADLLSGSEVVTIQEAGHDPWFEKPEHFFPLVREFLSQIEHPRGASD